MKLTRVSFGLVLFSQANRRIGIQNKVERVAMRKTTRIERAWQAQNTEKGRRCEPLPEIATTPPETPSTSSLCTFIILTTIRSHVALVSESNHYDSCRSYTQNCCKESFIPNVVVSHPGPGRRVSTVRQEGCEKTTAQPAFFIAIRSRPTSMSVFCSRAVSSVVKLTYRKPPMPQTCFCRCPSIRMLVPLAFS